MRRSNPTSSAIAAIGESYAAMQTRISLRRFFSSTSFTVVLRRFGASIVTLPAWSVLCLLSFLEWYPLIVSIGRRSVERGGRSPKGHISGLLACHFCQSNALTIGFL